MARTISAGPTSGHLDLDKERDALVLHWREVDRLTFDQIAAKLGLRAKSAAFDRYRAACRRRQLTPKLLAQRAHVANGLWQTIELLEAALFGIEVPPDMRLPVMDDKDLIDTLVKTYVRVAEVMGLKPPKQVDVNVDMGEQQGSYADDCVTRTRRRSRCRRSSHPMWCCARDGGVALRDRPAGGGPKPPQAAAVKSRGGERCGKGGPEPVRCEPRRRAEANHPMTGRKRIDGIESGVESLPRDEPGGNLSTAQAVPGLKVARARFRLWHGTCEPASRYRSAVHWTPSPPAGESETPKWQKPQGAE